jgi:hypothetical protein
MFANRLRLVLGEGDEERPVPKAWLDQFFLRSFTGYSAFDETLPVADGEIEAAHSVKPGEVREHLERWLRARKLISPGCRLAVMPPP